jgi:DGQHR domain-containing protein
MTTKNARKFTYEALSYLQRPEVPAAPRFLLLCAAAGDIVAWADVDRIDVHNPTGAQRPLRSMKVNKIAKYFDAHRNNTIPTAVIVALDESSVRITKKKAGGGVSCTRVDIKVEANRKPGLIIDGQHRAFGAARHSPKTILNVVAFLGGDEAERAFQFVVINNTATRVSKDHIKALNLNYNPKRLNKRLLESAGVGLGIEETKFDDLQIVDTTEPFKKAIAWPRNSDGFIPPNAIESGLAETRDRAARLGIEGLERDVFLSIWTIIKKIRKSQWKPLPASRLLQKVSIYALTVFVLDNLMAAQTLSDTPRDLSDEQQLEADVGKIVGGIPSELWTVEWNATELDTRNGRQMLVETLQLISANVRLGRSWYDGVSMIDPTSISSPKSTSTPSPKRLTRRRKVT